MADALASGRGAMVHGVGRDAEHVVRLIEARGRGARRAGAPRPAAAAVGA